MSQADKSTDLVGPHATGVLEQVVDDEMILYSPVTESYFTLNRSAREVWELADGTKTPADIANELAARYEMDAAALIDDVGDIIEGFTGAGLI